jgi:hypothetical protein
MKKEVMMKERRRRREGRFTLWPPVMSPLGRRCAWEWVCITPCMLGSRSPFPADVQL